MSIFFVMDIIFNFFVAYQDDNYNIIDDHKVRTHLITSVVNLLPLYENMVFY